MPICFNSPTLSHDLKAPLRAITQLADWISDDIRGTTGPETLGNLRLIEGWRCRSRPSTIIGLSSKCVRIFSGLSVATARKSYGTRPRHRTQSASTADGRLRPSAGSSSRSASRAAPHAGCPKCVRVRCPTGQNERLELLGRHAGEVMIDRRLVPPSHGRVYLGSVRLAEQ